MSASSSTFRQLLQNSSGTVERPRTLADGHYIGTVRNHEFGTSSQKQTPFVRLILVPEEATEDVDADANDGIDLSKKELRADFYITQASLYRLSDALDAILGPSDRVFDERLPELRGTRVLFQVTHRDQIDEATGDITATFNQVGKIVAYN